MKIPVLCSCSRGSTVACAQTSHPHSPVFCVWAARDVWHQRCWGRWDSVAECICSVWWLDEESCLRCYSISRCPMQEAKLQATCSLIHVQMWLSAVENERRIYEAFEVSCFSYASISSPAVDEMWKKIDHHPFYLLTILIML